VDYKAPTRFGNKGVEIEFRADTGQSTHKLYYFSVNLADDRLSENAPFLTYIASLKGATTLLKATSYMTHRSEFSLIREKILATSAAILQDDSGIPFRYLQTGDWKVQLYGDYQRPDGPRPLSFRVGYGYSRVTSNLLVAQRINLLASASPRDPHP
jgi:hypothetical protein